MARAGAVQTVMNVSLHLSWAPGAWAALSVSRLAFSSPLHPWLIDGPAPALTAD